MELLASFPDDSEVSSSLLKRFNNSVIDPKYLSKIAAITIYPFQATLYFLVYYYFYLKSTALWFPKWFGVIINTKFLKVLKFGSSIQIYQQV